MFSLNILDADKWRGLIREFDAKRAAFLSRVNAINARRAPTPAMEAERQKLLAKASPLRGQIDGLYKTLSTVRGWLQSIGVTLSGLGVAPLLIGVSLGAAALIVNAITEWLKAADAYDAQLKQVEALVNAGAGPDQIADYLKRSGAGQSSAKLFGFDVRWVLAIGALFIAGPYVVKGLERYRLLK